MYSIECLIRRWLRKAEITKQQECKHIRLRGWGLAVFYLASMPGQIMVLKDIQIESLLQKLRLNGWILSVSGVASERVCLFFNPFITWLGWEVGCTPLSRCHTEACRSAAELQRPGFLLQENTHQSKIWNTSSTTKAIPFIVWRVLPV